MKKVFISLVITCLTFFTTIFVVSSFTSRNDYDYKVAMITGFADVDDNSFNQQTYEGCKAWCETNNVPFTYYKPTTRSVADREKSIEIAIERGYNVIFLTGFDFAPIIGGCAIQHPDVMFFGIDLSASDFESDFVPPDNFFCFSFHEEIAGYLAGYATTIEGYRDHGFLGGLPANTVIKYGYGYAQGMNDAAKELNLKEKLNYKIVYSGQFYGDNDITKYVDNWYKSGTEVVFACGGSIYTSAALAAKDNGGKVVGVDVDQSPLMDRDYGKGICLTSACKGIKQACQLALTYFFNNSEHEDSYMRLGLFSATNLENNYVGIPIETWSLKKFSIDDYKKVIEEILSGKRFISDDTKELPPLEYVDVIQLGNIK